MRYVLVIFLGMMLSCQQQVEPINGRYELKVQGMKNVSTGLLEIVGEQEDYFGRITFYAKRERVYELGLKDGNKDSLVFFLPGQEGYLKLHTADSLWKGKFKYFGIQAELTAKKTGMASEDLEALVALKPIGQGVISTEQEESFPSYDKENNLLYFTRDQNIYYSSYNGTHWEDPELLDFSGTTEDAAPYIFNQGQSMLFTSKRRKDSIGPSKKNLWLANKINGTWSEPQVLPNPINIDSLGDYHGAISEKGNIYFVSYNRTGGYGRSDIFIGKMHSEGNYSVSNLGEVINSEKSEADVFVDPEENYILFASTGREDGFGADDIYISFKEENGWSLPVNLGEKVNSFAYEYGAWVDSFHGYLYFNSYRRGTSDLYRVSLEELEVFTNDL